jgi:ribonuclease D
MLMNTNYQLIKTEEELRRAVAELSTHQAIGLDTETTELDPYFGRLRLIQLASPTGVRVIDLDAFRYMQDTLLDLGVLKKRLPLEEHYTAEFIPVKA